ncbi:hypothetical protein NEOLEDRAFT_1115152 [Neolentinus lepideus HHB14362 ss-1]|uniref:Conserved oligomeric Golgi complex subunit 7 n=1 Tax=Neolentinus lepideus HHB14362 ss-1 TaxID=1314782 RepID=A0A165SBG6_9AGAM|nr:hypothetical protein NEOLEDRAFT_1115152 [Neolentinus lepideus HHB14362 ss-1]
MTTPVPDDIDVVDWLNAALAPNESTQPADLASLDKQLAALTASLEVAVDEHSALLGRLIDDVSRSVPRLQYDLHFMREGSLSLQSTLAHITNTTSSNQPGGIGDVLEKLHALDTIKTNMTEARDVLREAESWSMLEPEVTSLLAESNYSKAAERLAEAAENLFVFQNTPEYESRRGVVVSLENQLEAGVSSALVAAINSRDTAACKGYYEIFERIGREAEFFNYYVGARAEPIFTAWRELPSPSPNSSSSTNSDLSPFISSISEFYSTLLTLLRSERTQVARIFPSPRHTLSQLLSSILSSLQPSFSQKVSELSNDLGPDAVIDLVKAFRATESFALDAHDILKILDAPPSDALQRRGSDKAHTRRHSRRVSISLSGRTESRSSLPGKGEPDEWDLALFEPFLDAQTSYPALENRYLSSRLPQLGTGDTARTLKEETDAVLVLADGALARCVAFTHGYALPGLLAVLDALISSFLASVSSSSFLASSSSHISFAGPGANVDLFDLDYAPADYARIQALLHLLDAVRSALDRLVGFEGRVRSTVSRALVENDITRSDAKIEGMTSGEQRILVESGMNSRELHDLLQSLSSQPQSGEQFGVVAHPEVFPGARKAIMGLAGTCQTSLQDVILSPLINRLKTYPTLSLWASTSASSTSSASSAQTDLKIPTFSLSPSETMQRVAEGLLNLPRLFEVYADDDVLAFSIETLPYAESELARLQAEDQPHSHSHSTPHTRSGSLSLRPAQKPTPLNPETILSLWLSSLGRSLLSHLLHDTLPRIARLSSAGAAQLASDLAYLENIVQALNVEEEELHRWRVCVEMRDEEGREACRDAEQRDGVLSHVARIRGWPAS